ncbi:hypothetical protein ACOMHN_042129 [Nucella lapillus]
MRRVKASSAQKSAPEQPTANSFVTRSMVEALRDERLAEERGEQKAEEEAEDSEAVHISAEDWPFVYFVVALDQMPAASDDMAEYKASKTHTAKERQRILAARKRRIQQSRVQLERARESGIDLGLRLEPLQQPPWAPGPHTPQQTPARRKRIFQTRHPTTPISIGSNRDFVLPSRGGEFFLNQADQLTIEDMVCRGFSQWFTETFSNPASLPGSRHGKEAWEASKNLQDHPNGPRQNGNASAPGTLELPEILSEHLKQGMNGTTSNKSQADGTKSAEHGSSSPKSENDSREKKVVLQAPWSAPLTSRSMNTMAPRSKLFKHMPIPKVDIVSGIYDEVIVKTIQAFLEREGYSPERFTALRSNIMARLSSTYPHLARHRAWKLVRKDASDTGDAETDDPRSRVRLRPLHQGFFAAHSVSDLTADFAKENSGVTSLPHGSRHPTDQLRPRWVPVQPTHRPPCLQEEERCANAMFMSVDGRHIAFTPRDDLRFKTPTLPGATSDYRMAPLVLHDVNDKPVKTWTHIIPSAVHVD